MQMPPPIRTYFTARAPQDGDALAAAFAGMLLSVRQTYSRQDVLVVMGAGILGLTLTGVLAAAALERLRTDSPSAA